MDQEIKKYDVVVIGGGVSGTALLYTLSRYTNITSIALLEKYGEFGQVNSKGKNNSQTLHIGDIETNYSLKKASLIKPAALMIPRYINSLNIKKNNILFPVQKMVLAVGQNEVNTLEKRYQEFKNLYPDLQRLERKQIKKVEPALVEGRKKNIPILALFTPSGYAVDYEKLAQSFVSETKEILKTSEKNIDIFTENEVSHIKKRGTLYRITTNSQVIDANAVVVNTDAYSLLFAKSLGYGKEYSLIPVAGSFYFSKEILNGKVYTMQDKKLPFAAVHGDPDIQVPNLTRWGPTAKMKPVLETGKIKTSIDYFKSAGLFRLATIKSFINILSDLVRLRFLIKNTFYDVPIIGKYLFVKNIQKIVPTMRARDISRARGFGGMRLQRVNTKSQELELGEGKIIGENIIFNMTPSPGASVCLFNAMRDAEQLMEFFNKKYIFRKCDMEADFSDGCFDHDHRPISDNMYVS